MQQPDRNFEPCVPVPEGSKFRSGIAFTRFWKGASNRGPLATGQLHRILVGRTHPIRSRWLRIGAPFGWIDFRAMHNNGQCFKCALISTRNFQQQILFRLPRRNKWERISSTSTWAGGIRTVRRQARGFEISVGRGAQSKNLKIPGSEKSISKKDFQIKK